MEPADGIGGSEITSLPRVARCGKRRIAATHEPEVRVRDDGNGRVAHFASGTWNVFFGPVHLGWLDERDYRIHDHRGRTEPEHHVSPIR